MRVNPLEAMRMGYRGFSILKDVYLLVRAKKRLKVRRGSVDRKLKTERTLERYRQSQR